MSIRNMNAYDRGFWDWKILQGCFGNTSISPTDVDGLVERKGNFLFIETKQPGAPMPKGQEITLRSLAQRGHTVLIARGSDEKVTGLEKWTAMGDESFPNATLQTLREMVAGWFDFANKPPSPERMARILRANYSAEFRDRLVAELVRLDS